MLSREYGTAISFEMTHCMVPNMWLFSTAGPFSDGRENRSNFSSILKPPAEKFKNKVLDTQNNSFVAKDLIQRYRAKQKIEKGKISSCVIFGMHRCVFGSTDSRRNARTHIKIVDFLLSKIIFVLCYLANTNLQSSKNVKILYVNISCVCFFHNTNH